MSDTNEALRRLVAQVEAQTDVLVGGAPVRARQLMVEAAARLSVAATVVSVSSPFGELGLSALIAQLSGRPDLDEHDDAVLELGFKRLRGEGRTVLMVLAPEGVNRSALRYLQHVARHLPRLTLVVHDSPALTATLDEAGLSELRTRLHAASRIEAVAPPERTPTRALAVVTPAPPITPVDLTMIGPARPGWRLPVLATPARRPALWVGAALGAAVIAGIAFVVQGPPSRVANTTVAYADVPLEAAIVPEPRLADAADPTPDTTPDLFKPKPSLPAASSLAPPVLAVQPPSTTAKLPQIALAPPPPSLPSLTLPHPDPVGAPPVAPSSAQRVAKAMRVPPFRRIEPSRREVARYNPAPPYWSAPQYQPPPDYGASSPYDDVPSRWVRRERPGREGPYLGTYSVDPYGMRTFRYDP